ncbi:MAG: hypothetical protein IE933_09585 [Sphingomonadales bacterium]|nr:hypothetical protein [Sphingomonadales bacterium]MBD3775167.1 hypothetical protein [Paracoccaceae bacterium]
MIKHVTLRLAAATALAVSLSPMMAPAAMAQSYVPDRVKKSVETEDLVAIVKSLGHTVDETAVFGDEGERSVRATDENGVTYLLIGTACDAGDVKGCQGIMMQVRYDLSEGVTYETVAKANIQQAALNTWVDFEGGTLGFTRYQVLDYGVTMANIRENVKVLLDVYPLSMDIATGKDTGSE